jgi:hypothetical protein
MNYLVIDGSDGKIRSTHPTHASAEKAKRKARTGAPLFISFSLHPFREGDVVQDDDPRLKLAYSGEDNI